MYEHYLSTLFSPRSVAVFGANEHSGTVGAETYRNILNSGFSGKVFAINPKREEVQGQPSFANLEAVGEPVDLAIIATPAKTVPKIMEECGRAGTRSAIIMTAGFREIGEEGKRIEKRALDVAHKYGIRFIGPNSLGLLRPGIGLNATFSKSGAKKGKLALVSQSGALCAAIMDWAESKNIGFSSIVSSGNSADVDFGEIIDFLVSDPDTAAILLYVEGLQSARRFMSALRVAARAKPVVVMKAGRFESGTRAAISHSGAMVGADDAFEAALARAGVVRVLKFGDFFAAARILSSGLRVGGDRLAIITNGGGPGIMATDHLAERKLKLAELGPESVAALDASLPPTWSRGNPIDIMGDATPERYLGAVEIAIKDRGVDAVLVILTPQATTEPQSVAQQLIELKKTCRKPLLCCWMGDSLVAEARELLQSSNIPTFTTPEAAVDAFYFLAAYRRNQDLLLQVPAPISDQIKPDVAGARMIIENALGERRKILGEMEAKALLNAFHIPIARAMPAHTATEALIMATEIGFPVVMKINSSDITHKSDVGGVRLNITDGTKLKRLYDELLNDVAKQRPDAALQGVIIEEMCLRPHARELMLGVVSDPVFGPVISVGMGGTAVEALGDRAVALPPINRYLARDLVDKTRAAKLLSAFRNLPGVDMQALEGLLLRVSEMVCELPWLKEMDINPVLVDENGVIAVDARMVVDRVPPTAREYDHMAIHPYPTRLVTQDTLNDGTEIIIRPIRPEDALIEQDFVRKLSGQTKYFRFMHALDELPPDMLSRLTQIDYDREMAMLVTTKPNGKELEIGVARYAINPDGESCEFAIVIADEWQERGLGTRLMNRLMDVARERGLRNIEGEVLRDNHNMLTLMEGLNFQLEVSRETPQVMNVRRRL